MKRLGNIWQDVVDEENGLIAVIEGTRYKRKQHCVQKILNDDHILGK